MRGDEGFRPSRAEGDVRLRAHGDVENPHSLLPCQERMRLFIGVREKPLHGAGMVGFDAPCHANCGSADDKVFH